MGKERLLVELRLYHVPTYVKYAELFTASVDESYDSQSTLDNKYTYELSNHKNKQFLNLLGSMQLRS